MMMTLKSLIEDLRLGVLAPDAQSHFYSLFEDIMAQHVGERMIKEMPSNALEEYERFFVEDFEFIEGWLQEHYPLDDPCKYTEASALLSKLCLATTDLDELDALKRNFASMLWIEASGVDYSRIVKQVFCEMMDAAYESRQAIIEYYRRSVDRWDDSRCLRAEFVGVSSGGHE